MCWLYFEQSPIYEGTNSTLDKESLKVLEGWCLFFHHGAYKNLLCAFVQVSKMVYKTKETIHKHKDLNVSICQEIETNLMLEAKPSH